jgi:hypothetical protein
VSNSEIKQFQKLAGILKEEELDPKFGYGKIDQFQEAGGRELTKAIESLLDRGFSIDDIIEYIQNM